jgi:hypothetical protein
MICRLAGKRRTSEIIATVYQTGSESRVRRVAFGNQFGLWEFELRPPVGARRTQPGISSAQHFMCVLNIGRGKTAMAALHRMAFSTRIAQEKIARVSSAFGVCARLL